MNRLTVPRCRLARTAAGLFITLARQFWNWLPDEHSEVLMALVFLENNSFQPIQCDQRIKGFVTTIHALYISYVLHIYLCMCVRRCLAVSLHCVNFAASAISSRRPSSSRVTALVLSRLDYGNDRLVGLPVYLIRRLQFTQSRTQRRCDHITDALSSVFTGYTGVGTDRLQGADLSGAAW